MQVSSELFEDTEGPFGFSMELLKEVTNAELCLRIDELKTMVRRLHETGIIHGDLSVSNVMQQENGELRLIDFGLSGQIGDPIPDEHFERALGREDYTIDMDWRRVEMIHSQLLAWQAESDRYNALQRE